MSAHESLHDPAAGPRLDPRLLEVLVCPLTKSVLVYDAEKQELLSRKAALAYPIRNGVPLMTAEAARHLTDDEIDKL
jgi:uncharacterized protein YbaR (Trm112 family)